MRRAPGLSPLMLASEPKADQMPGGQLMFTTEVENFPGFPEGVQGPDLMELMKKQALRFGTEMIDEDVEEVDFRPGGPFRFRSASGWHECRSVIIATGATAQWLHLPNESKFRNRGLSACAVCDGLFFRNQEVMVVGGGDTAIEEALTLAHHASKVTIVHQERYAARQQNHAESARLKIPRFTFSGIRSLPDTRATMLASRLPRSRTWLQAKNG